MKVSSYQEFILENKGINKSIHFYTNKIIKEIEDRIKIYKNKLDFSISLIEAIDLKIKKLDIKVDIDTNFKNNGRFNYSKAIIENGLLDNVSLYLQLKLSDEEKERKLINKNNLLYSLLYHELNHILEFYKVKLENKKLQSSWNIGNNLRKHREDIGGKYEYWKDLLYFIYLGLNHEINSRVNELYPIIKNSNNPKEELENSIQYKDAKFLIDLNYNIILDKTIIRYGEETFFKLSKDLFSKLGIPYKENKEFIYKKINELSEIIKKRCKKFIKNLYRLIESNIKEIYNPEIEYITDDYFDFEIDYEKYKLL